jgi:PAS domain S-box-containing protein
LFEEAPCAYIVLELDGSVVRANRAFLRLSGVVAEEIGAVRFQKLLTSAGSIFYETQILPTLHLSGVRNEVALDVVHRSRKRIPVLANFALRYDKEGSARSIFVVLLEASERRLYEKDLLHSRRAAEQVAEVVLHSSDAIITLSTSDIIESWNNGAEQMFGYAASEAIGQNFVAFLFVRDRQGDVEQARALLRRGKVFTKDTLALHKDDKAVNVSLTLTPHMEAPGTLIAYSAIIRDESNRRLAERALLQSEKLAAVGRLASSIAHEINNPLASVTNLIFLARQSAVSEEQRAYLDSADEELRRVSIVASQTLRFHRQLTKPQAVSCTDLFSTVESVYQGRLRNSSILVEKRKRATQPVVCFEGDLRQVLSNLFTNAIDAMPTGGKLLLRSREGTDWKSGRKGVLLTVGDTGTGMSESTQAHIFEAFYTTKGIGGTGLGLWISAEIMERHEGRISIRSSQGENHRGTVAVIFLPLTGNLQTLSKNEIA